MCGGSNHYSQRTHTASSAQKLYICPRRLIRYASNGGNLLVLQHRRNSFRIHILLSARFVYRQFAFQCLGLRYAQISTRIQFACRPFVSQHQPVLCGIRVSAYGRKIYVRDAADAPVSTPVFLSLDNLAKEIELTENTEDIFTRLDVNGAEGVTIRDVNPTGTNKIINLDYYMTEDNFSAALIAKYNAWKQLQEANKQTYYTRSVQYAIKTAQKVTESANFLALDEFTTFKNALTLGEKVYVDMGERGVLQPITIGVRFTYDNPESMELLFSDSYAADDSTFRLVDLLEQSISMGKNLETSKYVYSSFMDSGASAGLREFMNSALDVARNAIMSSTDQAISWDGAGFRLRRWKNEAHTAYAPEQIWMNNNSIVMTKDGWATAEMAIGKFHDENLGDCWGIVAPRIVPPPVARSLLLLEYHLASLSPSRTSLRQLKTLAVAQRII